MFAFVFGSLRSSLRWSQMETERADDIVQERLADPSHFMFPVEPPKHSGRPKKVPETVKPQLRVKANKAEEEV